MNGEHVDFIDSSVTEEDEEEIRMDPPTPPLTAPPLVPVFQRPISIVSDPVVAQHLALCIT